MQTVSVHLRTHVERDCVSRVDKGRLNITRDVATPTSHPLPSFSLPALSAIVLPTDHVFVFLLSYPVCDCTPYHPCTLISLIMLHLSFHFHCPCTSISLVRKDASHPHRLGPCRANKSVALVETPTAQRDTKPLTGRTPPRMWRPSLVVSQACHAGDLRSQPSGPRTGESGGPVRAHAFAALRPPFDIELINVLYCSRIDSLRSLLRS